MGHVACEVRAGLELHLHMNGVVLTVNGRQVPFQTSRKEAQ